MCPQLPLRMARLYSVCQFSACWADRVKDSEAAHRLCEKQCHALRGTICPLSPHSLGNRSSCQMSQSWAVDSVVIGRRQ